MASKGAELKATIKIGGQIDPSVKRSLKSAGDAVGKLGSSFASIGKTAAMAGAAMAAAMGAVAVKIGVDCVKAASDFEKQMSNVATLLDGDVKKRVAELGDEIIRVSKETGVATNDLTNGAYQVISAFGDQADSVNILATAAKAAKAGNATTVDSVNLLSAVTKAYGDTSAGAVEKVADLAFMTVKLGQTDFPALASALPSVTSTMKTLGVSMEEMFGIVATLTGVTGNASEVATQLNGAAKAFMKPSKDMLMIINKMGYRDGQTMIKANGLTNSLIALKKAVGGNETAFANLFGSLEGKKAVLAVTGAQAENMAAKTKAMAESAGATNRAFEAQTDNLNDLLDGIRNYGTVTMLEIGRTIQPALTDLAKRVIPYVERAFDSAHKRVAAFMPTIKAWIQSITKNNVKKWIADLQARFLRLKTAIMPVITAVRSGIGWIADNKEMLLSIGKAVAVFVGGTVAVVKLVSAFFAVKSAIAGLIPVITFLATNPIGWVILGIAAIIAAVAALYVYWDDVTGWMSEKWQDFSNSFPYMANVIVSVFDFIKKTALVLWDVVCAYIPFAFVSVCEELSAAWKIISAVFSDGFSWFVNMWEAVCAAFHGDFSAAKEKLVAAFESLKNMVIKIFDAIKEHFKNIINGFISAFDPLIEKLTGIKDMFSSAKSAISNSLNLKNWFAAGGFTNGPSICGEAGTEAVISFDPAYRRENQGYLMTAAEMLGMTATPAESRHAVTYNLGGVTFAPVIKAESSSQRATLLQQVKACMPEFLDMIEEAMYERRSHAY